MKPLIVEYRQDPETKSWTATVPEVFSVVTQGKTLKDAHQRVRAALGLVRPAADAWVLRGRTVWGPRPDLSPEVMKVVRAESDLRVQALDVEAELELVTARAVAVLIHQEHQTYRFAGELLGITHQRVEQIAKLGRVAEAE